MTQRARNYLAYYHLETYLFEDVHASFAAQGHLDAFDFFSIVTWKANRAKSMTARRLLKLGSAIGLIDLDAICTHITRAVYRARSDRERLAILMDDWKFHLPMGSAILSVLYPERFTIHDYRVCAEIGRFANLAGKTRSDTTWNEYEVFIAAVRNAVPAACLRDNDRFLTGRSMARDLEAAIRNGFKS